MTPEGGSVRFVFEAPAELARFIASKGSIAVDGVSLTVNEVDGDRFGVNIIPHTQAVTTLGDGQGRRSGSTSRSICWRATLRDCWSTDA